MKSVNQNFRRMDKLKKFFNNFLDYLWPQFCLGCKHEGSLCCDDCLNKLALLPLDYQPWERNNNFSFDHCYVCLDYSDKLIQGLIKHFKYNYLQNLNKTLADILTRQIKKLELPNPIITNVPLHKKKRKIRGFDQTEILAKCVADNLHFEYISLLKRVKNTPAQAQLSKIEREKNVQNAFIIDPINQDKIAGQTIILIDDVVTTGSTLNEAAKILANFEPKKIIAVVLAKN